MNRLKKILLMGIGFFFLLLGIIGALLPVMPGIPFFIVAFLCFSGSSNEFRDMLLNNRWIGSRIRDFQKHKGLRLKEKLLIIFFQWLAVVIVTVFLAKSMLARILLIVMALGVTIFLLSLKTTKE